MRWVGIYLLHLLAATFGVMLATAILLNTVLKPLLEPVIGHAKVISIATGPYYPLPIVLAALAGYFGYTRIKATIAFGFGSRPPRIWRRRSSGGHQRMFWEATTGAQL
jgi:hypothetical protein